MSAFNSIANTNTVNYVPVQATFDASGGFLTFIGPGGVPFTAGGSLSINTTAITGGTSGRVLFNNAGTVGEKAVTGTGDVVLATNPTITSGATINTTTQAITIGGGQTSGAINIGGSTTATGTINIGRSTSNQTINVGPAAGAENNSDTTINIGKQTRSEASTAINIGNGSFSGEGNVVIVIGPEAGGQITMNGYVYFTNRLVINNYIETVPITAAELQTNPTPPVGLRAFINDAVSATFNSSVGTGGGYNAVPVFFNGSVWKVG